MADAIEQIYDQLTKVFGGTNQNQKFTMLIPGTSLNARTYAYDTTKQKPATVQEAESKLVDRMFDLAKVTASSNGQRLSSQYLQALSVLVPKFNHLTPILKKNLRDYLNTPMPETTKLNDQNFVGTLQQYYFKLYEGWITAKLEWDRKIVQKKTEFDRNPATAKEEYLKWYMQNAEAELAKINEAMAKVLCVFAPSDMDAILAALSSGPGGEIEEAVNIAKNVRLSSPNGGYFYPVDLSPSDWFLDLASDINPTNLLKDPEFIAATLAAKRQAIRASISQIQMIINQMPSNDSVRLSASDFLKAQSEFTDAQSNLLNTYTENTSTAIEIYLKMNPKKTTLSEIKEPDVADFDAVVKRVSEAKNDGSGSKAEKQKGTSFDKEDLKNIVAGQKSLILAQSALQTSLSKYADSGLNLGINQSSYFGELPILLTRCQSQLNEIENLQNDLATSISIPKTDPELSLFWDEKTQNDANEILARAKDTAGPSTKAETAVNALKAEINKSESKSILSPLISTAESASKFESSKVTAQDILLAVSEVVDSFNSSEKNEAIDIIKRVQLVAKAKDATAEGVKKAIEEAIKDKPNLKGLTDLLTYALESRTAQHVYDAVEEKIAEYSGGKHRATKSATSNRFMELQFSFSSSDMQKSSNSDTYFSQTSWHVDLFFGSAGGNSSSLSSVTSQNTFDNNTEIKIGLKAAKVEIDRGWFNPGVFKLTREMNRLSEKEISLGEMTDWAEASKLNKSILPSFPVAFLIAKDVNITFKVSEGSLNAVHEILDSRKAAGGGLLCFNVSSSSASHSDHSSLNTKTVGNVVTITIPSPQILGWFLELTPKDESTVLEYEPNLYTFNNGTSVSANQGDINIINFVKQLALLDKQAL